MENICTFVVQIEMKRKLRNIIERPLKLIFATSATWDIIASLKVTKLDLRKRFLIPWVAFIVGIVFIFSILYAPNKSIEVGIINTIITILSFIGGYFLSNAICFWYLRKQYHEKYSALACEKIVCFSFTAIFILKVITTVLPSLFFLQILSIYTAYLIWEGCRAILKLNEEERGNIVLVFTLTIVFLPVLIGQIIHLMLPNA
jgi:ABC-type multidrug transport system permease subunit